MISKKQLSYGVIHLFMFLSGVEYAVIFPTLWEYLQSLGVPPEQTYWLGICLSAMTVTDMVMGLLVGRIMDAGNHKIKIIVLALNFSQILGACLYLVSVSQYLVMVSRLVSGLGKSITIVFLTDICRSTSLHERTPVLLIFNIAFQIGLLIGPGCNLVLSQIEIDTGIGTLDKLNSPGLLLCLCWSLFSVLVLTMYTDLATLQNINRISAELESAYEQIDQDQDRVSLHTSETTPLLYTEVDQLQTSVPSDIRTVQSQQLNNYNSPSESPVKISDVPSTSNKQGYGSTLNEDVNLNRNKNQDEKKKQKRPRVVRSDSSVSRKSDKLINEAERLMREDSCDESDSSQDFDADYSVSGYESFESNNNIETQEETTSVTTKDYIRVLMSEQLVCLTYLRFVALFCQTCLESSVPPIMQKYFDYGDQANSILYLLAGVQLIIVFLILNISSRYISDRILISLGLVLMVSALSWLLATLPTFQPSDRSNLPYFAVGVILDLAGIPTVCDIGLSLYSKLMPDSMQGVGHGVRRLVSQLAIILGPIWGSGTMTLPFVMILVPLIMLLIGAFLYIISFKKLSPSQTVTVTSST